MPVSIQLLEEVETASYSCRYCKTARTRWRRTMCLKHGRDRTIALLFGHASS